MSDLVKRLRHCSQNTDDEYLHELAGRAADRIEALERAPDPELIKRAYDFVEFTRPSDGVEEWCSDAIDLIDALTGALEGRLNALTGGDDG